MHRLSRGEVTRAPRAWFALLLLVAALPSFAQLPSYEEAMADAEKYKNDPKFIEWADKVLVPYVSKALGEAAVPCFNLVPEGKEQIAQLVVELRSGQVPGRIRDDAPTPFSECLADVLRDSAWPDIPFELKYFPVELKVSRPPDTGAKAAEDVIKSIQGTASKANTP